AGVDALRPAPPGDRRRGARVLRCGRAGGVRRARRTSANPARGRARGRPRPLAPTGRRSRTNHSIPQPADRAMTSLIDRQRQHVMFTWSAQQRARPLEIVGAERARFEVAGKGWVWDLESQVYNVNVGHRHPHVQARMIEQIEALPACAPNAALPIRATLGELLAAHTGLAKAFLTTGGSEAVENAIKIARLVTGRSKIIARKHSYHGATLAVLEIAGDVRK